MICVFIVDDHPVVIEGIQSLLQNERGIEWAGHAMNAASCLGYFVNNTADVLLMDISMPGMDGVELCAVMKEKYPGIMILGLSTFNQGLYIKKMVENGASGYILKNTSPARLLEFIKETYEGGAPMSPSVATKVLKMVSEKSVSAKPSNFNLSEREKEVLACLVEGMSYKMIADACFISLDTVRSHIKNIYEKLHVHSKGEAVAKAIKSNIV